MLELRGKRLKQEGKEENLGVATEKNIWRVRAATKREKGGFWAEEAKQESPRRRKRREAVGKGKKKQERKGVLWGDQEENSKERRELHGVLGWEERQHGEEKKRGKGWTRRIYFCFYTLNGALEVSSPEICIFKFGIWTQSF